MKKVIFTVFIAIFSVLSCSNEQGITGTWKVSIENPQGTIEMTYVFKVNGEKLTGTISSPMGDMEISNGKIDGNNLSFNMEVMGFSLGNKGKFEDGVIKLKMIMPEGAPTAGEEQGEIILKRVE